jgi:hypothetical protein
MKGLPRLIACHIAEDGIHWHPQDGQKGRPAKPQRANSRDVLFLSTPQDGSDARTKLADFFNILLIAGWLKMTRRARLPGDGRVFGLFRKTAQAHFGCSDQFWIAALKHGGQQGVQSAIVTGCEQDSFNDGVERIGWNRFRITAVGARQPREMFRIAVEP